MKKIFHTLLLSSIVCGLVACSNGEYQADPDSNANVSENPITPLTEKEFTWSGDDPMSADINGSHWTADDVSFYLDTSGANVLVGTKVGSPIVLRLYLRDVWSGNVYSMEWKNYNRYAMYTDSTSLFNGGYYSYLSNTGGMSVVRNDSAGMKCLFYFKGVSNNGKVITVNKGFVNIPKW